MTYGYSEPPKEQKEVKKDDIQLPIIRKTKPVVKPVARTETKIPTKIFDFSQNSISEQQPKQEDEIQAQKTETDELKKETRNIINIKPVPKTKPKEEMTEKEIKEVKEEKKVENIFIQEMEPIEVKEEKAVVSVEEREKQEIKVVDKETKETKENKEAKPTKEVRVKKPHKSKGTKEEGKRKKSLVMEGQEKLSQIAEEVDGSDNDTTDTKSITGERVKKKWQLTEDQEKQIQEMSAQYGVEVEALKSYLETKAAQHHFNWLGIKRFETKVDMNLEIAKLESEYEYLIIFILSFNKIHIDVLYKDKGMDLSKSQ